jgi:hypothetical protein
MGSMQAPLHAVCVNCRTTAVTSYDGEAFYRCVGVGDQNPVGKPDQ